MDSNNHNSTTSAYSSQPLTKKTQEVLDSAPPGRYSRLPDVIVQHAKTLGLSTRDIKMGHVLMSHYWGSGHHVVWPSQETLALEGECSVDTVQRSLRRWEGTGLIDVERIRDSRGRLRKLRYNLSKIIALFAPAKEATNTKTQRNEIGNSSHHTAKLRETKSAVEIGAASTTPQLCTPNQSQESFVNNKHNIQAADSVQDVIPNQVGVVASKISKSKTQRLTTEQEEHVRELVQNGVQHWRAIQLAQTYDAQVIELQLLWIDGRKYNDRAAMLIRSIERNYGAPVGYAAKMKAEANKPPLRLKEVSPIVQYVEHEQTPEEAAIVEAARQRAHEALETQKVREAEEAAGNMAASQTAADLAKQQREDEEAHRRAQLETFEDWAGIGTPVQCLNICLRPGVIDTGELDGD